MSKLNHYLEAAKKKEICSDQRFEDLCGWGENEIEETYADDAYLTDRQIKQAANALEKEENLSKKQKAEYIERMMNVRDKIEEEEYEF